MAKRALTRGTTGVIMHLSIKTTSGAGATGLSYNSSGLLCSFIRPGEVIQDITMEPIATLGTYVSPTSSAHIRFREVGPRWPGLYEVHLHNSWLSQAGRIAALFVVFGFPGTLACESEVQLDSIDYQSDRLGTSNLVPLTPVSVTSQGLSIIRGDDYLFADSRHIPFNVTGAPSLTGATVRFKIKNAQAVVFTKTLTVVSASSCYLELTNVETGAFPTGNILFDIEATLANLHVVTIANNLILTITPDIR